MTVRFSRVLSAASLWLVVVSGPAHGEIAGAISISGVIQRMTPGFVEEVVGLLREHTKNISPKLGRA